VVEGVSQVLEVEDQDRALDGATLLVFPARQGGRPAEGASSSLSLGSSRAGAGGRCRRREGNRFALGPRESW
jgi:hypothetical protein